LLAKKYGAFRSLGRTLLEKDTQALASSRISSPPPLAKLFLPERCSLETVTTPDASRGLEHSSIRKSVGPIAVVIVEIRTVR